MGSRTSAGFFGVLAFALLSISGGVLYTAHQQTSRSPAIQPRVQVANTNSVTLITEPQDGMTPVERLIESASSSIDLVMYEFQDPKLEQLLTEEAQKGITVRVILDNGYFGAGSAINEPTFDYLRSNGLPAQAGVQVHWSPQYFALTHEKSLVVDNATALIMTFNFSPQYYKSDRDFGIIDSDPNDVAAMEQTFNADWNGQQASSQNGLPAQAGDDLVWSPNAHGQLLSLIADATSSLEIYNEEMQDPQIISALGQAAARGVNVEVDMTNSPSWKSAFTALSNAGVHVRTYAANASLYIHAKVMIADGTEAFVGSQNFSSTSLDQNRELGMIVSDPNVVGQLSRTFVSDWQNATPFLVQ